MKLFKGEHTIESDIIKSPIEHIPPGPYCYDPETSECCPFWDYDTEMPEQENGYCHYLKRGDWEINIDSFHTLTLEKYPLKPELEGKTLGEILEYSLENDEEMPPVPTVGLLWDQCKECNINEDYGTY